MYKIKVQVELPMAHCLDGAYSGLCMGNVDRNGVQYNLANNAIPTPHGHNNIITITAGIDDVDLDTNGMVCDFKLFKKLIHQHLDKYDHSCILTTNNPLVEIYKQSCKNANISFHNMRLFVIGENPTSEILSTYWYYELLFVLKSHNINVKSLEVQFEETRNNSCSYSGSTTSRINDMICGIYKLHNKKDNKIYIGQSLNILKRWHSELLGKRNDSSTSKPLFDAIDNSVLDDWDCSILELCHPHQLNGREQFWIKFYDAYNRSIGYNNQLSREECVQC